MPWQEHRTTSRKSQDQQMSFMKFITKFTGCSFSISRLLIWIWHRLVITIPDKTALEGTGPSCLASGCPYCFAGCQWERGWRLAARPLQSGSWTLGLASRLGALGRNEKGTRLWPNEKRRPIGTPQKKRLILMIFVQHGQKTGLTKAWLSRFKKENCSGFYRF